MASNLPSEMNESMLPDISLLRNTPKDSEYETTLDAMMDEFSQTDLNPKEIRRAVKIGIAAIKAEREDVGEVYRSGYDEGYEEGVLDTKDEQS